MGRRHDPRFAHCYRSNIQERDYSRELTSEEARLACERRREPGYCWRRDEANQLTENSPV